MVGHGEANHNNFCHSSGSINLEALSPGDGAIFDCGANKPPLTSRPFASHAMPPPLHIALQVRVRVPGEGTPVFSKARTPVFIRTTAATPLHALQNALRDPFVHATLGCPANAAVLHGTLRHSSDSGGPVVVKPDAMLEPAVKAHGAVLCLFVNGGGSLAGSLASLVSEETAIASKKAWEVVDGLPTANLPAAKAATSCSLTLRVRPPPGQLGPLVLDAPAKRGLEEEWAGPTAVPLEDDHRIMRPAVSEPPDALSLVEDTNAPMYLTPSLDDFSSFGSLEREIAYGLLNLLAREQRLSFPVRWQGEVVAVFRLMSEFLAYMFTAQMTAQLRSAIPQRLLRVMREAGRLSGVGEGTGLAVVEGQLWTHHDMLTSHSFLERSAETARGRGSSATGAQAGAQGSSRERRGGTPWLSSELRQDMTSLLSGLRHWLLNEAESRQQRDLEPARVTDHVNRRQHPGHGQKNAPRPG